jgi:hypothetical protein
LSIIEEIAKACCDLIFPLTLIVKMPFSYSVDSLVYKPSLLTIISLPLETFTLAEISELLTSSSTVMETVLVSVGINLEVLKAYAISPSKVFSAFITDVALFR